MASSSRVTLHDIAERLDLTKVSVSKALRGHPDISTSTKARVRETAQKMGYMPNRLAQSLSTNETGTVGVVVPKIAHTFFSDVLGGVYEVATENDYEIFLCVSQESESQEKRHLRKLLSLQVDGLLVSISENTEANAAFEKILDTNTPLVFFDRALEGVPASRVLVDDEQGAYDAVEHAIHSGHRQVAHIAGEPTVDIGRKRRDGYVSALEASDIPRDDTLVVESGFDEAAGYRGMRTLLDRGRVPDALFAVTVPVALGAEDAIRESDRPGTGQIQIYSFGQHSMSRFFTKPHISVHQPAHEMGKTALSILLEQIDHPDRSFRDVILPTRLVEPNDIRPPYSNQTSAT